MEDGNDLAALRREHGLEPPGSARWSCRIGFIRVTLSNFAWRQAAIDAHDRHHILTGYPLTLQGEIQMTAWEWGAGRFPDWRATLFCSPLIVLGALTMPKRTWAAYRYGCRSESLYGTPNA